jgi:hypothetical protein
MVWKHISMVALLCVSVSLFTVANAMNNEERKDNLLALYMVRASEPVCGFKMTDEQHSEVAKATRLFEESLGLSKEKIEEIYRKVIESMKTQKAEGLCSPDGEHARVFRQAVEGLAPSGAGLNNPASPATPPPSPAETAKLTGLQAWQTVKGNTIIGQRNELDYADYYAPDGRIVSLDGSDIEVGSWKLKGDQVCSQYPSEDDACYRLEVLGDIANFIDEDGIPSRGTILKGNPKNL